MKAKKYAISIMVTLLISLVVSSCAMMPTFALNADILSTQTAFTTPVTNIKNLVVHYIDVGQADSILIQLPNSETVLIDGGNKDDANAVISYIKALNIKKIDYLIATHPHEDHIGGLPEVVKTFEIGQIYMPKVSTNIKIFEELLLSIKNKGLKVDTPIAGTDIINVPKLKFTILAPNSDKYEELNEYSIVTKLTYKNNSFLFTGDAESISENEMLKKNYDLKADVLKIGHHGGRTSTTTSFLTALNPKYAVISVGKANDYGHPNIETLDRLKQANVQILRTDELGTIIFTSDGINITVDKKPLANIIVPAPIQIVKYIGNKNSKIFHLPTCSSLPQPQNQVIFNSREEAIKAGYTPCQRCKP